MSEVVYEVSDPRFESDGIRHVTVRSPALRRRGELATVGAHLGRPRAVLVLLHGVYGSHISWLHHGGAHEVLAHAVADGLTPPLLVVTPSDGLWGDGSGYVPTPHADHERWIVDEVVTIAREVHDIGADVPLFIAGLSMGGYGALRLAGRHRGLFAGAAAHSTVTRLADLAAFATVPPTDGVDQPDVIDALTHGSGLLPPLRFDCGVDDDLIRANRQLHHELLAAQVPHEFAEHDGGHDWDYWRTRLVDTLRFVARHL